MFLFFDMKLIMVTLTQRGTAEGTNGEWESK
jgi:hypothetical protein